MTTPLESPWKESDPVQRVRTVASPAWLSHCHASRKRNVKRKSPFQCFMLGFIVAIVAMILAAKIFPSFFLQLL